MSAWFDLVGERDLSQASEDERRNYLDRRWQRFLTIYGIAWGAAYGVLGGVLGAVVVKVITSW